MNVEEIKKLCFTKPEQIKKFKLTEGRIKIIKFVIENPFCTSKMISLTFMFTIQSTSILMKKLHDMGYINREETISKSGGVEYLYTVGSWVK